MEVTMVAWQEVDVLLLRHSVLDTESSGYDDFWIPAFAGKTVGGIFTEPSH